MKDPLVSVIIPSWNNADYLRQAVVSLLRNQTTKGLMEILVINNGHPQSCDFLKGQKQVRVINAGRNLGWEGGIMLGVDNCDSEFICLFNDDAYIPTASRQWVNQMIQYFRNPQVAAVGPSSNVVMGYQNIFADVPIAVFEAKFLIGFCVMMRRKSFVDIGGMDMALPGGDDLDWSIRFRDAGYKLVIDRNVFVFHHGFKTGERVYGDPNSPNGWNSYEKTEKTNLAIIKKHGMKKWWELMRSTYEPPKISYGSLMADAEGKLIRELITKKDKVILDLGCGEQKTLRRAIGVDMVKKGDRIPTLEGDPISVADIQADITQELPVEDNSVDVVIVRHVLEHMIDPIIALEKWTQKLKVGGRIIIAVPNEEWQNTIPMNVEHVHAFTPSSLMTIVEGIGLKVERFQDSGNGISFIGIGTKV